MVLKILCVDRLEYMIRKSLIITSLACLVNVGIIKASVAPTILNYSDQASKIAVQCAPHAACTRFETTRLELKSISSAEQDIACYLAIYSDCGEKHSWFSGVQISTYCDVWNTPEQREYIRQNYCDNNPIFESEHERIKAAGTEQLRQRERNGFYNLQCSFPDYAIFDKETSELVGKFISCHKVKNGRIENGIYILGNFRKQGYGQEVLKGVIQNVVRPALGKPFRVANDKLYPEFKGMLANISPWYNYPSLKLYCNAGCVTRWNGYASTTFYPAGNEQCLDEVNGGLRLFLEVIKLSYMVTETFEKMMLSQKMLSPVHLQPREVFGLAKKLYRHEIIELVINDLKSLQSVSDDSTAKFTQEAIAVLDEEEQEMEEDEEIAAEDDTYESGRRRQREE